MKLETPFRRTIETDEEGDQYDAVYNAKNNWEFDYPAILDKDVEKRDEIIKRINMHDKLIAFAEKVYTTSKKNSYYSNMALNVLDKNKE